jgi:uncharacterized protein (DUF849 family)
MPIATTVALMGANVRIGLEDTDRGELLVSRTLSK